MKAIGVVFLLVCLTGCDRSSQNSQLSAIDRRVRALELKNVPNAATTQSTNPYLDLRRVEDELYLPSVESRLNTLSNRVGSLAKSVVTLEIESYLTKREWISLDPTAKHYSRIDTEVLPLFIVTKEFAPYLDGYKIKLQIGNPYFATFSGFKVTASWHKSYQFTNGTVAVNLREVDVSRRTNEFNLTDTLTAGAWTPIEFTIAPASVEEIRNVTVKLDLSQIQLREK